jgi:hypothetical protein
MITLKVHDLMHRRALITRESAAAIKEAIANAFGSSDEVTLDFSSIDAVTPSFMDELIGSVDDAVRRVSRQNARLVFLNVPTRLSAKFAAIGRAHRAQMFEPASGEWEIRKSIPVD